MQKLIRTRQGAILYAVVAPLLAGLFLLLGHASGFWRFPDAGLILLSLLMGFGVCALILLLRWVRERLSLLVSIAALSAFLTVLALFPVWAVSVVVGIPLWGINLIYLSQDKYPRTPMSMGRWWVFLIPVALIAATLLFGEDQNAMEIKNSAPGATPAEAFGNYRPEESILAELPMDDDSVLVLSDRKTVCRMVQEGELWQIAEVYRHTSIPVEGDTAVVASCSRGSGEMEVVWVWKQAFALPGFIEDNGINAEVSIPPRDTAGSEFMHFQLEDQVGTTHYYVTLVDVDAPGYVLYGK